VLPSIESRVFDDFGPTRFGRRGKAGGITLRGDLREARLLIRKHCGLTPGVYGMIDSEGELIYVGKSKALKDRLLSYFHAAEPDAKSRKIVARTERLVWEGCGHEFSALLRELELIRRWQPPFNVQGRPGRLRRSYVCLGRGPAPYAYLGARPTSRSEAFFGPVPASRQARDSVRRLNDHFRLRDCPEQGPTVFSEQLDLFPEARAAGCLRYDVGTCLAPCAGACSGAGYAKQVREARQFLAGSNSGVLDKLQQQMRLAAAGLQFERAAALRDSWENLSWLIDHLCRLRHVRKEYSFVYPLSGVGRKNVWFLIRGGQVAGVVGGLRDGQSALRSIGAVERVFSADPAKLAPERPEDIEILLLISAWFRRHPQELENTLSPQTALQLCFNRIPAATRAREKAG